MEPFDNRASSVSHRALLNRAVVSAEQMRQIEERIFAAGMPVAALMEKVAGLIAARIMTLYPPSKVGVLVGPGHNGGDAAVVARELHLQGYEVNLYRPFAKLKELTAAHFNYASSLGIAVFDDISELEPCNFIIDGLFGFGLERTLSGSIAEAVKTLNSWQKPVVSIDLPSGIHTDTGEVLGVAVRSTQTFCLGLWKCAFFQDEALGYCGDVSLVDFGIPEADIEAILSPVPAVQRLTREVVLSNLPLPRPAVTHKYKQGHLLLICGSRRYAGGAILTALGARASGVGMLSVAVPESLKPLLVAQLPEALVVGCPETESGAIADLPDLDLSQFSAIACGPGITLDALPVVERVLSAPVPLILDADALNALARLGTETRLSQRSYPTILTPHVGEFKRLFPDIAPENRIAAVREAALHCETIVLLKGARTAIANPEGQIWLIPESTPALARGGSGDVLSGLMGGLVAQQGASHTIAAIAAEWHARAGILAARKRTELGVDAFTLTQYLTPIPRS
ncbi:NAD(P)H-hydrate dehydratase [Oscillatoria sp. FACHB-1406]|uniref:NAD(P)H-hydrate dehydratase n=1 Tax=Oscillatoria sp. FACHB-1406 TaxID=2692846 RepID=UPI0016852A30|nr:NAD(P)H-hydrate dehydratase [Oscillatoria sp. FACHB-1406]MBD2579113.1 NAD(P)H-hydrate dehydratase [Oscillatoria sp. FACHB-1406]